VLTNELGYYPKWADAPWLMMIHQ